MTEKTELDNAWNVSETDATNAWDHLDTSIDTDDLQSQGNEVFDNALREIDTETTKDKKNLLKDFFNNLDNNNLINLSDKVFRDKDTNAYLSRKKMTQHPLYALITEQYVQRLLPGNNEKINSIYDSIETIKKLQELVGTKADGKFGPYTLEKAEHYLEFGEKSRNKDGYNPYDLNTGGSEGQSANTEDGQTTKADSIDYSKDDEGNSIDFDKDENGNTIKEILDIKGIPDTIENGNVCRINIDGVLFGFGSNNSVTIDGYGIHTWKKENNSIFINGHLFTSMSDGIFTKDNKLIELLPGTLSLSSIRLNSIEEDKVYAIPLNDNNSKQSVICFFGCDGNVTIPGKAGPYKRSLDANGDLLINNKAYTSIDSISQETMSNVTIQKPNSNTPDINANQPTKFKSMVFGISEGENIRALWDRMDNQGRRERYRNNLAEMLKSYSIPLATLFPRKEEHIGDGSDDSIKYWLYKKELSNGNIYFDGVSIAVGSGQGAENIQLHFNINDTYINQPYNESKYFNVQDICDSSGLPNSQKFKDTLQGIIAEAINQVTITKTNRQSYERKYKSTS